MSKILVTGVNGFVGKHLVRELGSRGHDVIGLSRDPSADPEINASLADYWQADLTQPDTVSQLTLSGLDAVINLAGLANQGSSYEQATAYKKINVDVLRVLAEQLLKQASEARVVTISTGAVYDPNQALPFNENSKLQAGSPYSESKILMEQAAADLRGQGLDCVIVRPFNHFGPGQAEGFILPDLYKKLTTTTGPLRVGNLKTRRDYTDVRDIARAYADLALTPDLTEDLYNICSNAVHSGEEVLNGLAECLDVEIPELEIDHSLVRPQDPAELRGSYDLLHETTGWKPQIAFKQTIQDFVDWKASL